MRNNPFVQSIKNLEKKYIFYEKTKEKANKQFVSQQFLLQKPCILYLNGKIFCVWKPVLMCQSLRRILISLRKCPFALSERHCPNCPVEILKSKGKTNIFSRFRRAPTVGILQTIKWTKGHQNILERYAIVK